jgi:putative transposase
MAAGSTSNGFGRRMASRNWSFPALPARGLAVGDEPDAVSTRRFRRSVRLPDGDVASIKGDGTSKSAVVRGLVERETEGLAGERSVVSGSAGDPDLHVQEDLILVAAVGIDAMGEKHPLGLVEGATENAATVQALLDNLVERGLDPTVVRLFIIDAAKALSKAIRRTFGRNTPIQRCQVHKARNIAERLPKEAQARGSSAGLGDGGGPNS